MVTIDDARAVKNAIVKEFDPHSVVVFGSVAKNGKGNDLDLVVVVDDKVFEQNKRYTLLMHRCIKPFYRKFPIDPFIIPLQLLNDYYLKGSPFLKKIFNEGRLLYMKDAVLEWLKQAGEELNMAEYLLTGGYHKGACYHAQQCLEKTIKAKLLTKGWELEKTHNIERLIAISEDYKIKPGLSEEEVIFMDTIYRGRYPAESGMLPLGEPAQEDAKKAVTIARRIFKKIQQ
jgi:HEPN domain-containing protein/predicted nucleotidyltransferase